MKPRAFIVAGPECSATRLTTRFLIAGGCHGVATAEGRAEFGGWPQYYDLNDPQGETPIVIRRTLPYHPFRQWPDLDALYERISACGYDLSLIITSRDADAVAASQAAKGYVSSIDEGIAEIHRCYSTLEEWFLRYEINDFTMIYENMVVDTTRAMETLRQFCGLPAFNFDEGIYDGNEKYFGEQTT
jgi:hypothetical protein